MTAQVKVGAIMRRGSDKIPLESMRVLVENESKVQEICDEIDARSAAFREQAEFAEKKLGELEKAGAELAAREAKLVDDMASLEAERAAAEKLHATNMEALARRTSRHRRSLRSLGYRWRFGV